MLTRTELREVFNKYNFRPLKRFGENYLIDANIKDKIVAEALIREGDTVVEIGPGFGALTIDLAKTGARIYAVEKDRKAFSILGNIVKDDFPNLKIFNEDILKFDLRQVAGSGKVKIVGNLPYYITTPLIEYFIENRRFIGSALVTMQREVANRLLAGPGTKDYGSLSCFVQYYMKPRYIHTINRTSFHPEPEVDSSLIRLEMLQEPSVEVKDEALFFKIVRGAFNQRRKLIANSLSREAVLDLPKDNLSEALRGLGISPSARPGELSLSDFARIANSVVN